MEVFSFIILAAICYAIYYWISPSKKQYRKQQSENKILDQKADGWKNHPLFPSIIAPCKELVDSCIERAKKDVHTVDSSGREKSDSFAIWYRFNELITGGMWRGFKLDTNVYSPLTSEQISSLMKAIYDELNTQYGSIPGLVIKFQEPNGAHSASVFIDLTALHPKKYLQDIGI